jgi:hypothetical protein
MQTPRGAAFTKGKSRFDPSPKNVAEYISKDERTEVGRIRAVSRQGRLPHRNAKPH